MNQCTRRLLIAIIAFTALALTGCASKAIEIDGEIGELTPSMVRADATADASTPDAAVAEQSLLWGGVIVGMRNRADGSEIEVLSYPLDRRQRPRTSDRADARFLVRTGEYLEPVDFAQGRLITVLGRLDGLSAGQVGETPYDYPTLLADEIHLWSEETEKRGPNFSFGIGVNL